MTKTTKYNRPINVLSLFNGMSTGHQALFNLGIQVNKYYSSEIKPAAIKLTQHHFPETIQLGNILNWKDWDIDWASIDLLLSGSPCKDLSIAGKRKGIHGSNSGLFWVFIDIMKHINSERAKVGKEPVLFLQENVGSAPKKDVGIMSRALGVYPVRINSALVTAQLRDRYYWSNIRTKKSGLFGDIITDIPQPVDRGIMSKDVIENGYTDRYKFRAILESESRVNTDMDLLLKRYEKFGNIVYIEQGQIRVKANTKKGYQVAEEGDIINLGYPNSKSRRGRVKKTKSSCLLEGNEPLYVVQNKSIRPLNKVELCRLQGFPDDYCDILTRNQAASLFGDGWTLPVIEHIFSYLPFYGM